MTKAEKEAKTQAEKRIGDVAERAANGDTAAREELTRIADGSDEAERAAARKELGSRELDDRFTKTGRERAVHA